MAARSASAAGRDGRLSDEPLSGNIEGRRRVLAIFGPTGVGKTSVAIAVADALRRRGEDPVAVSCDAIQVYRGLETLSGAATPAERELLEHRLVGFVDPAGELLAVDREPNQESWAPQAGGPQTLAGARWLDSGPLQLGPAGDPLAVVRMDRRGDVDAVKRAHRAYARRQLTWMRKMEGVEPIDRSGRDDESVAEEIVALLGKNGA